MKNPQALFKRFVVFCLFVFAACCGFGTFNLHAQSTDAPNEEDFLIGPVSRADLQSGEFGKHFLSEYQDYLPKQEILTQLKPNISNYDLVLVLGTWCHDSQKQVPRFYKILDALHYKTPGITSICVDKKKEAGATSIDSLNISLIPTFIILKNKKEVGRIIETPSHTLEEDLLKIISSH